MKNNEQIPEEPAGLLGLATQEQIRNWKQQHAGGIYALETGGHIAYFKNPGRQEVNCALRKSDKDRVLDVYEELAAVTFLGGSEEVLRDDRKFLGICRELKSKLDGARVRLVNL